MKNRLRIILLKSIFLLLCQPSIGQSQDYSRSDCKKSCNILHKQMMKEYNYALFSDDDMGEGVFRSKLDFKVSAILKCIAVMKIDEKAIRDYENKNIYVKDTSTICAFLFKRKRLTAFVTAIQLDYLGGKYIGQYRFVRDHSKGLTNMYNTSLEKDKFFFIDNTFNEICYRSDGKYYQWDYELSTFRMMGDFNDIKNLYIKYHGG